MNAFFESLTQNDVAVGGASFAILSALLYYCRSMPVILWDRFLHLFTVRVEILNSDILMQWIIEWFTEDSDFAVRSTRLHIGTEMKVDSQGESINRVDPKVRVKPAPGAHLVSLRGVRAVLTYFRWEDGGHTGSLEFREAIFIRVVRWRRKELLEFFQHIIETYGLAVRDGVPAYVGRHSTWEYVTQVECRRPDTLVLPEGVWENFVRDVSTFYASRSQYELQGIPWRRGYLLSGPPGNGKTSLVRAIATDLNLGIASLNLSAYSGDDLSLVQLVTCLPPRTLLLMEDVDCVSLSRSTSSRNITLSGLLNALDGVWSTPGRVLVMTTNYPEKLDDALLRPGRVDKRIHLPQPNDRQMQRLCDVHTAGSSKEVTFDRVRRELNGSRDVSMARVQEVVRRIQDR